MLGFDVDKPSEISMKVLNVMETIDSNIRQKKFQEEMILSSSIY